MRDFPCTVLPKNHRQGIPTRVLYLDSETTVVTEGEFQVHYMKLAWTCLCYYTAEGRLQDQFWHFWEDSISLCQYISRIVNHGWTVYLIAHNVFFDLQACGFFKHMPQYGWKLDFFYDKGLKYILCVSKEDRKLKCISSTNFYECSLKELGAMLKLPKLGIDFQKASKTQLIRYCKRDVEILKRAMEMYFRFLLDHDLGKFSLSMPVRQCTLTAIVSCRRKYIYIMRRTYKCLSVKPTMGEE